MAQFFIGLDDTDNETSSGTGQLARRLVAEAVARGATHRGITRHQFLQDPRIPCTRRNRGICIGIDWPESIDDLQFAADLIADWSADGSDPAICIAQPEQVTAEIVDFGQRASRDVLEMRDAIRLAQAAEVKLRMLGGSGSGIIGALCSVGLRAAGNDGRFVDLPGLRELAECVDEVDLARMGIAVEYDKTSDSRAETMIETLGWIRPRLLKGRPVLPVTWSNEHDAWISVDQKRVHTLD